jgi:serine/threonine-protein kinase
MLFSRRTPAAWIFWYDRPMDTPFDLLKIAAIKLLHTASSDTVQEGMINRSPQSARNSWTWLPGKTEAEKQSQLALLAQAPPAVIQQAVARVVAEVAAAHPPAARRALSDYLTQLPGMIRQTLRRTDELEAATILPGQPMRVTLTVTAGPHKGQTFTFVGHDTFLVGRSQRAHFRLAAKDRFFSRIHFMVEVNPPNCRLIDMGSRNGTQVNDNKVETADLKDGDQIKAGHTILRVRVEAGGEGSLPPDSSREPASAIPAYAPPAPLPVAVVCRVCAGALGKPQPASGGSKASLDGLGICPACQEEIRRHSQPVTGYHLVRQLGRGGMGVVYLAVSPAHGTVAVKTILPAVASSPSQTERFLREARILQQLDHPHIITFREMGESKGLLYFAMDYIRGTDAGRLVKEQGPLPVGRAVGLVCQLLQALEFAHARGLVHRDIKPANLLVASEGGREMARLADFGLARVYQTSQLSGLTLMGEVAGTLAFMAPEQITQFREAKPPVDQYAAGATLYYLLTGQLIYQLPQQISERILMILQEDPVPLLKRRPDLPAELAALIHRSLAREPEARFAGVKEMRQQLLRFSTGASQP